MPAYSSTAGSTWERTGSTRERSSADKTYEQELYIVALTELGSDDYVLKRPITALVEIVGDEEYLALFAEASLSIAGKSLEDAISALKAEILDSYELYRDERRLGPEPARRLRVLEGYIGKKRRK